MGSPAAVLGDQVTGVCATHLIPNPASGLPQPGPPMPFAAPLTLNVATRVLIGGRPAALLGSSGMCTPPHIGLHPTDPFFTPVAQTATVLDGSPTVLIEGRPAARTGSQALLCAPNTGTILGSVANVLIA